MDIREGDLLVIEDVEYPIRAVAEWSWHGHGSNRSMKRMATVRASTKRSPAVVDGKRGSPSVNIALWVMPLAPVDAETRQSVMLDAPHELKETYAVDGDEFYHLVVEVMK